MVNSKAHSKGTTGGVACDVPCTSSELVTAIIGDIPANTCCKYAAWVGGTPPIREMSQAALHSLVDLFQPLRQYLELVCRLFTEHYPPALRDVRAIGDRWGTIK